MQSDRGDLGSVTYWRTTPDGSPQRFYIAFCLLMSSVQDTLLGLKERELSNLNWSVTCSYYGLVHLGRMLAFLALGDFPTNHSDLIKLMLGQGTFRRKRRHRNDGFAFDWLGDFSRFVRSNESAGASVSPPLEMSELRGSIIQYLDQIGVTDPGPRLEAFAVSLEAARPLRNDSNYEALLIAHEYEHVTVSAAFRRLADAMSQASTTSLPLGLDSFSAFLARDPDLESDRAGYRAFTHDYLDRRLRHAIMRKLGGSSEAIDRLGQIIDSLRPDRGQADYSSIEYAVSMDIFESKTALMRYFDSKIEVLMESTN